MKIYTRSGDDGQTNLADGRRVPKNAIQPELTGTLDELNSLLGIARSLSLAEPVDAVLQRIQSELFLVGAAVAGAGAAMLTDQHVENLEADIDRLDAELPPLKSFIMPGGATSAAVLHLARTVCRRAERRLVTLTQLAPQYPQPTTMAYLNRLSDLLFVMARAANAQSAAEDPSCS